MKSIWLNGSLIPWGDAKVHVLSHALHYGDAVFEGIRAYTTKSGTGIFRLREHMERLVYSAKAIGITIPFSVAELCEATVHLVRENGLSHGYIRPLVFNGYGIMGLNPAGSPVEVMIACWPWGKYLPHDMVDIKTSSYIRIHPRSTVADAKISGHYVNSILAVQELRGTKYHEALFLDLEGNIAEGPGENFFMVKAGVIYTPPLGTILAGITRNAVMQLAKREGIEVVERAIPLTEALGADEAFFTGTAAEVSPIRSIDDAEINGGVLGPISAKIKDGYARMVIGEYPEFKEFVTVVS
jgi:branched-chain amino acid aminotransferase